MTENEIGGKIIETAIRIHKDLGPGLLESVYEIVLKQELLAQGLKVERQVAIPIKYKDYEFNDAFRADLVVEDKVIVELKGVENLNKVCRKQLLTYLRLADIKLGYLLNFGKALMKDGIVRTVNGLAETE